MLCDTVFSNVDFKTSKLQEHFDNLHGGAMRATKKNLCKLKEPILILE